MVLNGPPVIVRRYILDRYGDRVLVGTWTVQHTAFAPRTSFENDDRATSVTADADLYLPAGADVTAADEIELADGTRWEVRGAPERWASPFAAWTPGVLVALHRVTG